MAPENNIATAVPKGPPVTKIKGTFGEWNLKIKQVQVNFVHKKQQVVYQIL